MSAELRVIALFAGKRSETQASVELYNQSDALQRGLRALGYCWGAALLTLPIPVIHLVLPPILAVGGLIAFALVYLKTPQLPKRIDGDVACCNCQQPTHFHFEKSPSPYYSECQACRVGYELLVEKNEAQ